MTFNFKKILPDVYCIALFAAIAFAYFMSPISKGYRLEQHDSGANDGINVEINAYRDAHEGETPRWVTSLFGGMPTYQIAPSYDSTKAMSFVEKAYHLWFPDYVWYIFASMLGFYILLRAFDFRHWMAALGAVVWAFSSYFFIIIAAGHIWKVMALAYIPPTIAGIALCYRKKYLLGTIVTAIFATLQIQANHVQMSYYFLTIELLMVVAYLIQETLSPALPLYGEGGLTASSSMENKPNGSPHRGGDAHRAEGVFSWLKATGCVLVAAVIAICLNISNLYHTYEYSEDTMRGKSELVKQGKVSDQTDSGLERSYITAWSYGIDESLTFLIPDVKGGASMPLSMNKTAMKKADGQLEQMGIYGAFTQYWGEQPGTSGPVYLGALVCMLFVMGLLVIPNKHPLKWALLIAGFLTLLLSWGHNFMPFTDWFIDHVPMYSKFRTVASILVVVEFVVPFIALWGLKLWVESPRMKPLLIATVFTVVICLIYVMAPGLGHDCLSMNDKAAVRQYVDAGYFDAAFGQNILRSISDMRGAMVSADAWRSILFILLGVGAMWWYGRKTLSVLTDISPSMGRKPSGLVTDDKDAARSPHRGGDAHRAEGVLVVILLVICLVDMWGVNKRYLHDDMFVEPQGVARIQKTDADKYIIEQSGDGRDYRVLNFTVSTFNDNTTSAFYSSVGGYHAAKLRRYQELIEAHIAPEMSKVYDALRVAPIDTLTMMERQTPYPIYDLSVVNTDSLFPVINMLNTRWFILGAGEKGEIKMPVENVTAMGNAWFVTNIQWAANANEELDALSKVNLRNTAVVAKADFGFLKAGGEGTVKLTSYEANEAKYEVESAQGGLVVFSEVYYPGWTATIDGQPAELGRANYVLRALNVPSGKHEVVLTFKPQSIQTTESIAYVALAVLVLLIVAGIVLNLKKKKA